VWQKARELTREVYKTFRGLNDYGFKDQIQRAAVSVMSNIAEGFERGTKQELLNYLFIAKGSCGEVRCQLYVALDAGYLNDETFERLKHLSEDCVVLVWRFIQSVKASGVGGLQFRREKSQAEIEREEFEREMLVVLQRDSPEVYEKYYKKDTKDV